MADVEGPLEFREVWSEQVKEMLSSNDRFKSLDKANRLPLVASPLRTAKPEAYIPQFLSLGPYHHSRLEKDGIYQYCGLKMSAAEAYKVISAATISHPISADTISAATISHPISADTISHPISNATISAATISHPISADTISHPISADTISAAISADTISHPISDATISAATISHPISAATISHPGSLTEVVQRIQKILPDIVKLYDLQIQEVGGLSKNFALMMAVDASFLLIFLFDRLGLKLTDIDFSQLQVSIKCDILKLENQIPLAVLKLVFDHARNAFARQHFRIRSLYSFKDLLLVAYKELSPFDMTFDLDHQLLALEGEPHILGCIHVLLSRILETRGSRNPTLLQRIFSFIDKYVVVNVCGIFFCFTRPTGIDRLIKGYSAGQLARAGVKFKSFSKLSENIQFEECSHTLYLPPLILISSIQTEVFFRNLVALEFNDKKHANLVTRYVGLMDCLIDTPDDVRVLMDSHVIRRGSLMLTEEHIAKMWDGMCQPFFTGHLEPPEELKQAFQNEVRQKYYKVKIKVRLAETWDYIYLKFFSRPWKFLAFLFAILLLSLNTIQAVCNLVKCRSGN